MKKVNSINRSSQLGFFSNKTIVYIHCLLPGADQKGTFLVQVIQQRQLL
jgi:hypothetical protein